METEMTNELKAQFFALYWGQVVALITKGSYTHPLGTIHVVNGHVITNTASIAKHRYSLQLKPLSSITENDAIELGKLLKWTEPHEFKNFFLGFNKCTPTGGLQIDFFRSKGYAVDWMGISVEQQVQSGWVKLITTNSK